MRLFKPTNNIPGLTLFPASFVTNKTISGHAKAVYLSYASRAQENEPEPTEQEVADEMGLDLEQVRDAISELDAISEADWKAMEA